MKEKKMTVPIMGPFEGKKEFANELGKSFPTEAGIDP